MKLKILKISAILTGFIGTILLNRFVEGGTFFMSLILVMLLLTVYFALKCSVNLKTNNAIAIKMLPLINESGILALSLGFMSAFLGLITAIDILEASGEAAPAIVAGGLKIALLSPLFGLFTFSVSKVSILVLRILLKQ